MRVWRLFDYRTSYALHPNFDPLDGQGAALYPGRWNQRGVRLLYTSQSPELAMLELLTKLTPATFGTRLALEIALPQETQVQDATPVMLEHLLRGENDDTQIYGSSWVAEARTLVLKVPSAVLPVSFNYLINPAHPQAKQLEILRQVEVSLDSRLVRSFHAE